MKLEGEHRRRCGSFECYKGVADCIMKTNAMCSKVWLADVLPLGSVSNKTVPPPHNPCCRCRRCCCCDSSCFLLSFFQPRWSRPSYACHARAGAIRPASASATTGSSGGSSPGCAGARQTQPRRRGRVSEPLSRQTFGTHGFPDDAPARATSFARPASKAGHAHGRGVDDRRRLRQTGLGPQQLGQSGIAKRTLSLQKLHAVGGWWCFPKVYLGATHRHTSDWP